MEGRAVAAHHLGASTDRSSSADGDQAIVDAGQSNLVLTCDVVPYGGRPRTRPDLLVRWTDSTHY